jgi:hypothetical protein
MLKRPTVFVLGAGASRPFGFPTGLELSDLMANELSPGNAGFNSLISLGYQRTQILNFRNAFFYSGKNSVDAFLEHRTDLIEIGKAATAAVLSPFERPDRIFSYQDNWLRSLYNNLNASFEEFGKNRLSVITFNYDRVVEHFFFESLRNSYQKSDEQIHEVLKRIPVIHLHGNLGYLPWEGQSKSRPFSNQNEPASLRVAAQGIKIIHEDITDGRDRDFERAKVLLAHADQIYFMGFGFNKTNMDRLGLRDLPRGRTIMATGIGMSNQDRVLATQNCDGKITLLPGNETCDFVVRERIIWT